MGKPTGFMEFEREAVPYRDPLERLNDYDEINTTPDEGHLQTQGARCMDCGVPFCQSANGCPIDNLIPEWNHLVYQKRWKRRLIVCTRPTTFRSSPVVYALHRAKARACSVSPIRRSPSRTLRTRSSTAPLRKAG